MKKLYIFLSIFLSIFTVALINNSFKTNEVSALEIADVTTTTTIDTNPVETTFYDVYNSLVDELYSQVYSNLYDDLYQDIVDQINQEYYEQIYAQVESDLAELLREEEISVYLNEFQQTIYDVIELSEKSVFGVTAFNDEEASIGTGVVYKYDNVNQLFYIVTNHHVIENMDQYRIYFATGDQVEANLIGYDENVDIAVLTFQSTPLPVDVEVATFGDSDLVEIGEFALAVGHPTGYDFFNSVTLGIISGLDRVIDANAYVNYIQHDAAINSGNSGGPIYNLDGEVIGINVIKYATVDIEGMGFSIPSNLVLQVIQNIENN
ncbi:S1C family serine protease [Candidatus Izemoplasma sp. B36]|uniref:S1C family serine protease n=1 Tax=Candidatus Izemoplasma sp. B36 TaxID=3242468 RepID=UPI003556060E